MTVFDLNYLCSGYADNTTFFKDIISIKHMFHTSFRTFQVLQSWKGFKWQSVVCVVSWIEVDPAIPNWKSFGTSYEFRSNSLFKSNKTNFFPSFYREIILNWKNCLAMITEIHSCISSQYLWYNRSIQVDNPSVYFLKFSEK